MCPRSPSPRAPPQNDIRGRGGTEDDHVHKATSHLSFRPSGVRVPRWKIRLVSLISSSLCISPPLNGLSILSIPCTVILDISPPCFCLKLP